MLFAQPRPTVVCTLSPLKQQLQRQRPSLHRHPVIPHSTAEPTHQQKSALELMRRFSEQYCERSGTYFCEMKSVTATVIHGLAEHKETVGAPLCPCRHYDDKAAEAKMGYWNCPCVPMRERKECHCMLFLTEDNDFAGRDREISMEEIEAAHGA